MGKHSWRIGSIPADDLATSVTRPTWYEQHKLAYFTFLVWIWITSVKHMSREDMASKQHMFLFFLFWGVGWGWGVNQHKHTYQTNETLFIDLNSFYIKRVIWWSKCYRGKIHKVSIHKVTVLLFVCDDGQACLHLDYSSVNHLMMWERKPAEISLGRH